MQQIKIRNVNPKMESNSSIQRPLFEIANLKIRQKFATPSDSLDGKMLTHHIYQIIIGLREYSEQLYLFEAKDWMQKLDGFVEITDTDDFFFENQNNLPFHQIGKHALNTKVLRAEQSL